MRMRVRSSWPILRLVCIFAVVHYAHGGSCGSSAAKYTCPNCGGMQVKDCSDCDGYLSSDDVHHICFDRKLFAPTNTDPKDYEGYYNYLWNDIVAAVIWFVVAGISIASGVGGGGIFVPLGILLLKFSPKQSSGLSQASIFGSSVGGLLLNMRNKHPNKKIRSDAGVTITPRTKDSPTSSRRLKFQKDITTAQEEVYKAIEGNKFYERPLIDYDMALYLSPIQMAGAVLGVLIQTLLPNWLYLLIAVIVLSFTAYKTYSKFFEVRAKETEKRRKEKEQLSQEGPLDTADASAQKTLHETEEGTPAEEDAQTDESLQVEVQSPDTPMDEETKAALRKRYLEEDMKQNPVNKWVALIVLWTVLFVLTLLKGGKGMNSIVGITCADSGAYGSVIALQFIWPFCFSIFYARRLVQKQEERRKVDYPFLPDDPVWDLKHLRFFGTFTFLAGIVAALIGVGGGMFLAPFMLSRGMNARVVSATNAVMVVLTSSTVAIIFVTSGLVPWSYALFYFGVCVTGALVGKSQIDGIVKRSGRSSILIFTLATIIALSTIGCFVILLIGLSDLNWCFDGFNQFCKVRNVHACSNRMLASFESLVVNGGDL